MVQGVNFRFYAKAKVDELGIKGFVRNEPDDSVYIEAEGEEEALDKFIQWCKTGPPAAKVDNIVVEEGEYQNFTSFETQ